MYMSSMTKMVYLTMPRVIFLTGHFDQGLFDY
jgi:hypothetical protein